MTVSSITPVNNYAGNGSTTTFDFDFLIENENELKVQVTDNLGIQTTLTPNIDYTIHEVGNEAGSYITYPKAGSSHSILASDEVITLSLELDIEQEKEIKNSSKLNLITLEWCLDYLTRIAQIQKRQIERAVKVQEGSGQTADELIEVLQQAQIHAAASATSAAESANNADISATTAETFAGDAEVAYDNTVLKYNEMVDKVAEEKQNIQDLSATEQQSITVLGNEKISEIQTIGETTVNTINTTKTAAINDVNNTSSQARTDINTLAETARHSVQALGIYMENDALFYFDEHGVKHQFRNDYGGIAPMAVIHKDIQKVANGFALTWTDPKDSVYQENVYCTWGETLIVRKEGSYPESPYDGEVILTETVRNSYSENAYIDEVDNTIDYKYRAFPRSINKVFSVDDKNKFGVWVYAFEENDLESNPAKRITYLEDNENFRENKMNFSSDEFDYGDWGNSPFYHWDYIRPCMVYTDAAGASLAGKVMEYLDPNDHSKTITGAASHYADQSCNAQAMAEKRKIFLKVEIVDENRTRYYFSNQKHDNNYECYSCLKSDGTYNEFYYTPMFHGSLINNKLVSLAGGLTAMSGKTAQQEIDYARANGNGWDTEVWSDLMFEEILFRMLFKNTDAQAVLGVGVTDNSSGLSGSGVSGRAYNKGINYGTTGTNFPVKFRYRENFYAYQWQRFRGLMYINGIPYVKMTKHTGDGSTATDYNITGSGYKRLSVPAATGTSGGYISKTKATPYGTFSTVVSGSSSTYLCDGRWFNNSGTMHPYRGGTSGNGSLCGSFCLAANYEASFTYWGVGAALSYKPL